MNRITECEQKKSLDLFDDLLEIANTATREVYEENRRLGIPTPFCDEKGKQLFMMPDGTITDKVPPEYQD